MKTKAQQLGITKFPYVEYDKNGYLSYREWGGGIWFKKKFDKHGNRTYLETSSGHKEYYVI